METSWLTELQTKLASHVVTKPPPNHYSIPQLMKATGHGWHGVIRLMNKLGWRQVKLVTREDGLVRSRIYFINPDSAAPFAPGRKPRARK